MTFLDMIKNIVQCTIKMLLKNMYDVPLYYILFTDPTYVFPFSLGRLTCYDFKGGLSL